jgi:hypothetical protein
MCQQHGHWSVINNYMRSAISLELFMNLLCWCKCHCTDGARLLENYLISLTYMAAARGMLPVVAPSHSLSLLVRKAGKKFRGNINKLPCFYLFSYFLLYSFAIVHVITYCDDTSALLQQWKLLWGACVEHIDSDLPFPSSVKVNKTHSCSVYCTVCAWHGA